MFKNMPGLKYTQRANGYMGFNRSSIGSSRTYSTKVRAMPDLDYDLANEDEYTMKTNEQKVSIEQPIQ